MQVKKGIPVSPGVGVFPAVVLDPEEQAIPRRVIPANRVTEEFARFEKAIDASRAEIEQVRDQTSAALGKQLADIFGFHLGMLGDPSLVGGITTRIENDRVTAEYAVYATMQEQIKRLSAAESDFLREKVSDLKDLERRVLRHLLGRSAEVLENLSRPTAVIAHDLTPSQTAGLDKERIKAIATDAGGRTSHTAILAHALGIPAIVGLEDITSKVATGDTVIIDGYRGVVIIEPDAAELMEYRQEVRRRAKLAKGLKEQRHLPAVTKDGTRVELLANIEFPSEIEEAVAVGAEGVGLYRTEFHFLAADHEPSEEEQYQTIADAVRALGGRPLTVRTLDLGADKVSESVEAVADQRERNPFLGCRSIRLCLQNLPLFRTQLRAILRASAEGPVRIMFPLISHVAEMRQAKMILADVREDLEEQGIPFGENIPIGMMVEVPSAALQIKTFLKESDFFSIGTNDLIQYTIAVDRSNERIANLYSAAHPAVIRLVKDVIRTAQRGGRMVSLCGEMAGEPEFVMLLLGLGLRRFSITPPAIPEIKQIVRAVTLDQCQRIARRVAAFDSDREVLNYLKEQLEQLVPEVYAGAAGR